MKKLFNITIVLILGGFIMSGLNTPDALAAQRHALFTEVLQDHVKDGLVNYEALKEDKRFNKYIEQLSNTDPQDLISREEKMAFWINVYNAYTLKIICDNYPIKSISELHTGGLALGTVFKKTVWHKKLVRVKNELTSLDYIEHKILRPEFRDPRIHFSIVCAAKGCPPLRSEAYEAEKLNDQLNDQAKVFLEAAAKNSFNLDKNIATISPIFQWFKKDFSRDYSGLLVYLCRFLPEDIKVVIERNPKKWKIKFSYYDWSLNEQ
jgi:hypothetical protein